jgi:LPS sulfotransferase NodH
MRPRAWWDLLKSGRFRVHPTRIPLATGVTIATLVNLFLGSLQQLIYRRRLAEAELHGPPVFVVGHWRSGTTLLHELMVLDERLSSPSTFQCFAPHHFLLSEWFFQRFARWLLPNKRPMDNMETGWDRPQEDEFALLALGLRSPYRRMAFPNQPAPDMEYLDFERVDADEIQTWLDSLRSFLVTVSVATGRPLVVKSPTHTGRIEWLAREFPDAKFIHITRDPCALFPSTCRLWRGLDEAQALQRPTHDKVEPYVIECLQRMYDSFHTGREKVSEHRLIDIRYEDLVKDPVATMQQIYETLRLSDFETVRPVLQQWVDSEHKEYKTNRHQLDESTEAMIRSSWHDYFLRYGYE